MGTDSLARVRRWLRRSPAAATSPAREADDAAPPALRVRRLAVVLLGVWLLLWHLHSRLAPDLDLGPAFSRWAYVAILLGAAALCAWRAAVARRAREAWALFTIAIVAWAAGDVYFTAALWDDRSPPVPSPADAGYLLLPPLVLAGVISLLRAHARDVSRAQVADGLVAGLAVGALSAAVSVDAVMDRVAGSAIEVATNLAYPVGDVVLLAVIAGAIAGTGWRPEATLWTLALGISLFAVADSLYVVQVADATYEAGGWLDAGWSFGIWLIAVAACQTPMKPARRPAPDALRPIVVPLAFGTSALGLLVFGCVSGDLNVVATTFAGACLAGVMARLFVTFREHVAMLRASQREALTDSLTGLRNRRALQADVATAIEDALATGTRRTLVLLDIDGIRDFNAALGRHAGDGLVARLANRLRGVLEPGAVAYRTRGGEFGVVAHASAAGSAELAAALERALAERIEGIDVRCCASTIELPTEATTVPAALRLAGQRLAERRAALQNA